MEVCCQDLPDGGRVKLLDGGQVAWSPDKGDEGPKEREVNFLGTLRPQKFGLLLKKIWKSLGLLGEIAKLGVCLKKFDEILGFVFRICLPW